MSEYPRMLYGEKGSHVIVTSRAEEEQRIGEGYGREAGAEHRKPPQERGPSVSLHENPVLSTASTTVELMREYFEMPAKGSGPKAEPLTEAHIPAIVDAVFERLRGMAQAAAEEPAAREAAEGVEALRAELDERFAALKGDLLGSISALIAPAPAAAAPSGKKT